MTDFVVCKQVVKAYKVSDHEVVALRGIDFTMKHGEMVAIIGPSGAGKTSLLNLLGGLDTPTAGQLSVGGQNLLNLKGRKLAEYRLRQVGFLWQQIDRNLLAHRTALHNVTLPMMLAGVSPWERRKRAKTVLETVGLGDYLNKRPVTLSGGQQQRVAFAVALANHPSLLLMDEPTGALDRETSIQTMALISDLREKYGLTILMVTHNLEIAGYADRVLTLRDGALGQELSEHQEEASPMDDEGRVRLPQAAKNYLSEAARISIEVRPEGVLLRPEVDDMDIPDSILQDMLPQDAPPQKHRLWHRLRRKKETTT